MAARSKCYLFCPNSIGDFTSFGSTASCSRCQTFAGMFGGLAHDLMEVPGSLAGLWPKRAKSLACLYMSFYSSASRAEASRHNVPLTAEVKA